MTPEHDETLTAAAAAAAIHRDGWRVLLDGAYSSVAVGTLPAAVDVAAAAVACAAPTPRTYVSTCAPIGSTSSCAPRRTAG